jgi:hypothetical protein
LANYDASTMDEPKEEQVGGNIKGGKVLKGGVQFLVPQGTGIKLKLASVPTNGMRLLDRDLDGNLYPAKAGDEITARTSEDLYVDDNKVLPEGTVFHGSVSKILPARRLARPGSLEISFDSFTTPDGRKFAFAVQADNKEASTAKTKLKGFGRLSAHFAGGAIVGALVAYQIFGLHNTIAMHGYNIAAGAGAGGLLATGFAIMDKGHPAQLEPGDDLNMQIDADLLLPAAVEPTAKGEDKYLLPGLEIKVEKTKLIKDGLGGHILRVQMIVRNNSNRELNSVDAFCEDTNGTRNPLCMGSEIDVETNDYIFNIYPHHSKRCNVSFQIEYPKLKRSLVWLDHDNRQICYKQPLP